VLSTRTVEKHLEAIYTRLGVESRGQAITASLQALWEDGLESRPTTRT